MSESDMFPPPDEQNPKCGICRNPFSPGVSLKFCSEECIRTAFPHVDRADHYFVQLRDAENCIDELMEQIDFHFGIQPGAAR